MSGDWWCMGVDFDCSSDERKKEIKKLRNKGVKERSEKERREGALRQIDETPCQGLDLCRKLTEERRRKRERG